MPRVDPDLIEMLLARLERVPVDSFWAHRASGIRGSLLDAAEAERSGRRPDPLLVEQLTQEAFRILERAATERSRIGLRGRGPALPRRLG